MTVSTTWVRPLASDLLELVLTFVSWSTAPHPMYSVGESSTTFRPSETASETSTPFALLGYAGFYGLSIIVASYTVLFVSIAAHAAQFGFLLWFENPRVSSLLVHAWVDQTADRATTLMQTSTGSTAARRSPLRDECLSVKRRRQLTLATVLRPPPSAPPISLPGTSRRISSSSRTWTSSGQCCALSLDRCNVLTCSSCRSTDLSLVLLLSYAFLSATLFHKLSPGGALFCHFVHALGWRVFHSFGLGTLLKKQSENRWLVRHFLKHYAYPAGEDGAVQDAFTNWKATYNLSLSMTYGAPSSNRPIYLSRADRLDILLQLRSLVLPGRPTPFLPTGPLEANSFDTLSVS